MTFKNEGSICNHNTTSTTSPFPLRFPPLMQRSNRPFFAESSLYLANESVQEGNHYHLGTQVQSPTPRSLRFGYQDHLPLSIMVMPSPLSVRGGGQGHHPLCSSSLCSHSTISEIIDIVLRIINEEEVEDDHEEAGSSSRRSFVSYTPIHGAVAGRSLDEENDGPATGADQHKDSGRKTMQEGQHQE